jgi:hypothetical protein
MAKITIPVEAGSQAVKDGSIGKLIQTTAERWTPEAMYFRYLRGQTDGLRGVRHAGLIRHGRVR